MDQTYLQLLDDIFSAYDTNKGASRITASVFHDRMLNQFFPRYYALSRPEPQAFQDKTPDEETPLQDVVVPSLTPTDGDV